MEKSARVALSATGAPAPSPDEALREDFERDGFLILDGALPPSLVQTLTAATDRIWEEHRARDFSQNTSLHLKAFVTYDPAFLQLLDHGATFPLVCALLGWNIFLYHCHLDVNPPVHGPVSPRRAWHRDGGRINDDIEVACRPRMSVKVAFFLSDASEQNRGNLQVVPGSHTLEGSPMVTEGSTPPGAVPILARPGTAVLFDRRLWHARSDNHSSVTRKVLFLAYSYRWVRPRDDFVISREMLDQLDPIKRQLMGASTGAMGHYVPGSNDVPIRSWMQEQGLG